MSPPPASRGATARIDPKSRVSSCIIVSSLGDLCIAESEGKSPGLVGMSDEIGNGQSFSTISPPCPPGCRLDINRYPRSMASRGTKPALTSDDLPQPLGSRKSRQIGKCLIGSKLLSDACFPEADALGKPVAVTRAGEQLQEINPRLRDRRSAESEDDNRRGVGRDNGWDLRM